MIISIYLIQSYLGINFKLISFIYDQEKDKPAQSGSQVHPTSTRQTVQGFFSQYTPKKGQQYYRDLAGNIKQVSTPDLIGILYMSPLIGILYMSQ
jgi:hypothetical protein